MRNERRLAARRPLRGARGWLDSRFLRCAKAMIVNIRKIRSVKSELNARMRAELLNGEQIVISRGYVKDLKEKLGV